MKNDEVVITSAVRTAICSFNGSLSSKTASELGSIVIKKCVENSNLKKDEVDMVYMGQVLTAGVGQNPARQSSIFAGLPNETTNTTINQVCGSGLRSIAAGYQTIMSNDSNIVVAGGQESMSNAPHAINICDDQTLEKSNLIDTMINDGLWDAFNDYHMGMTAEIVAAKLLITREDK